MMVAGCGKSYEPNCEKIGYVDTKSKFLHPGGYLRACAEPYENGLHKIYFKWHGDKKWRFHSMDNVKEIAWAEGP